MTDVDRWDIELWAANSRKGEVCGIIGCHNKPVTKCERCLNWYCEEHKDIHWHSTKKFPLK